jgi:hypothetical protein
VRQASSRFAGLGLQRIDGHPRSERTTAVSERVYCSQRPSRLASSFSTDRKSAHVGVGRSRMATSSARSCWTSPMVLEDAPDDPRREWSRCRRWPAVMTRVRRPVCSGTAVRATAVGAQSRRSVTPGRPILRTFWDTRFCRGRLEQIGESGAPRSVLSARVRRCAALTPRCHQPIIPNDLLD